MCVCVRLLCGGTGRDRGVFEGFVFLRCLLFLSNWVPVASRGEVVHAESREVLLPVSARRRRRTAGGGGVLVGSFVPGVISEGI